MNLQIATRDIAVQVSRGDGLHPDHDEGEDKREPNDTPAHPAVRRSPPVNCCHPASGDQREKLRTEQQNNRQHESKRGDGAIAGNTPHVIDDIWIVAGMGVTPPARQRERRHQANVDQRRDQSADHDDAERGDIGKRVGEDVLAARRKAWQRRGMLPPPPPPNGQCTARLGKCHPARDGAAGRLQRLGQAQRAPANEPSPPPARQRPPATRDYAR